MDIQSLIPVADAIPVHWGWLQFFLILTFTLHLLVMNVMLGSALIACFNSLRGRAGGEVNREISRKLPYTVAFTVNLGVAPLLFLQVLYGNLVYVSSILMAVYWLSVIFLVIAAYYLAYIYDFRFDSAGLRTPLIAASACCLLVVGFFFSSNMVLMISPHAWEGYFSNSKGLMLALSESMLIPRYLHFVLASTAIAGLAHALYWNWKEGSQSEKIRPSLKWFTHSTSAQIFIGLWFLLSLPKDSIRVFMGGSLHATAVLALGSLLGLVCLYFSVRAKLGALTVTALLTVVCMVFTRDALRVASVREFFHVSEIPLVPQYSPMILFVCSLLVGLGLIAFMIRLSGNKEA